MRILFISEIITPFWIELSEAINNTKDNNEMRVAFCSNSIEDRGEHWKRYVSSVPYFVRFENENITEWINIIFNDYKPDVVICGGVYKCFALIVPKACKDRHIFWGYYLEQPNKSNKINAFLKRQVYRLIFRFKSPGFIFAIGDRATDYYNLVSPRNCHVSFLPYYQDLSMNFKYQKNKNSDGKIRFLFSGRLHKRNSIKEMAVSFDMLAKIFPFEFTWCISAYGTEEKILNNILKKNKVLNDSVYFDRDFSTWEDRLRPFKGADVILVPAKHSGWGLVVPEALSLGVPVISTRHVESARFYLEETLNGLFIEAKVDSIFNALVYCLKNKNKLKSMSLNAKKSAEKGDVQYGANRLISTLDYLLAPHNSKNVSGHGVE